MLTIRVLGKGLIPRGFGLAPRMEPFKASLSTIEAIISTRGLTVEMQKPDGTFIQLTPKNMIPMWNSYNDVAIKTATATTVSKPVTPEPKFANTASTAKTETVATVANEKTDVPTSEKADDKAASTEAATESKDDTKGDEKNNSGNFKVVNNPNDHQGKKHH